jgi:hypothetical protein
MSGTKNYKLIVEDNDGRDISKIPYYVENKDKDEYQEYHSGFTKQTTNNNNNNSNNNSNNNENNENKNNCLIN